MSNFVLVHGGFHGGWCWRRVADRLRAQGHAVWTPTLTGMGERSHLLSASVDLETHIADVMGVLEYEDLEQVVLVGHSYAGMVITGVADRAPGRLARLVYLDALLPEDGESSLDVLGAEARQQVAAGPADPAGLPLVMSATESAKSFGVTDPGDVVWLASKLTPMPIAGLTQPLSLAKPAISVPALYVTCSLTTPDGMKSSLARAQARAASDPAFRLVSLAAAHDAMVTHPDETAAILAGSLG